MRIRHVLSTVGPSAPAELVTIQDLTLRSIERALRCAGDDLDVEVIAVRFPDEPVDREWLVDMPILERSVLDLGEFAIPRRLPLLSDVLAGFGDPADFDLAVYTNIDIAVQPYFYDLVADLRRRGDDAISITRRTVHPRYDGSTLAELSAAVGTHHPGDDCIVMASNLLASLRPTDVALGVRWVARNLLWQLVLAAESYRHVGDLHATFHLGDDRIWTDPRLADYEAHNERATHRLVEALANEFGDGVVRRLTGTAPFLDAIRVGEPPEPPRSPSSTSRPGRRPPNDGSPRLVFCANPGRSGSGYLAALLDLVPAVSAHHERAPQMAGAWLRRVMYEPSTTSYRDRLVKVDAIRVEVEAMGPGEVYVDSSHMFVKTFADVVFDSFQHERLSVVHLRRDPIDVARSFFELDYFGPHNPEWSDWMFSPTAPQAMFRIAPDEIESQFDLIFGYLVDTEARSAWHRDRTPGVDWIDVRLEEIVTVPGAGRLLDDLGLRTPADLGALLPNVVNSEPSVKSATRQSVPRSYVNDRWSSFVERFGSDRHVVHFAGQNGLDR